MLVIFTLAIIGACAISFLQISLGSKQVEKIKSLDASYGKNVSYNPETETLSISAKYASLAERVTVKSYVGTQTGYTPEKLIYTSATVGGITTGGFDKVGGYGTAAQRTSKYNLFWLYLNDVNAVTNGRIKKICLSEDLVADTKDSEIGQFVEDSIIMVEDKVIPSKGALDYYARLGFTTGDYSYYANVQQDDIIASLPTKDKCQAIVNWLSNGQ